MWRSNVLRLRHCSSTTTIRYGVNRRHSSERSLSITAKEFESALEKVLKWKMWAESKRPLGFAVSGGVDSMALATLYTQAQETNRFLPKAHGFVVDHKVRPESTEEAEWVAQQLRWQIGMEATVLSLTWPEGFDKSDLRRFETEARTLRYQALGRACRDKKITSLMVAHHGNDQAETVMMRLASKRLRSGLQAMHSVEWIPECEGIYGVYHSGKNQKHDTSLNIPFPVEQGGIQILRPLLGFEKSRLVATCEEKDVAWAEDKTNQVRTLTARNAIRHIYKNHKLPEALSTNSLVDVSLNMQKRVESHKAYAQKLFDQSLIKVDIQTGCLLVRFPPVSSLLSRPIETESDQIEAKDNAYCLIERVAGLVTPMPKAHLGQLAVMIEHIYPELENPEESEFSAPEMQHFRKNRSVYGIWWRVWDKPSPFEVSEEGFNCAETHPREWLLTRQPLYQAERSNPERCLVFPPLRTMSLNAHIASSPDDTYQLFDGRFWIRLRNHSADTLMLRVFDKSDLRHLSTAQEEKAPPKNSPRGLRPQRFISAAFALLKPSDLRFTLPAVFRKDSTTGEETLVGFPTLDVRMSGSDAREDVCEWSVRYKKIDFGSRGAGDIIVPGSSRADIFAEEKRQRIENTGITRMKLRHGQVVGLDEDRNDTFTGYKKGSERTGRKKKGEGSQSVFDKLVMDGKEVDELKFLEEATETQRKDLG